MVDYESEAWKEAQHHEKEAAYHESKRNYYDAAARLFLAAYYFELAGDTLGAAYSRVDATRMALREELQTTERDIERLWERN